MSHQVSFKHAFAGIKYAFFTQPNFRIHTIVAVLVIILAIILTVTKAEWLALFLAISLVFVAEMHQLGREF